MAKYRKRPVVVEAVLVEKPWKRVREFCPMCSTVFERNGKTVAYFCVPTPEGSRRAELGDYIIKGVGGEFYPCKPGIFHATYDLVEED